MVRLNAIDSWVSDRWNTCLMKKNTELYPTGDGGVEVHEDVPGYEGYSSRTHLSLEIITELLRVQGYLIVKDESVMEGASDAF